MNDPQQEYERMMAEERARVGAVGCWFLLAAAALVAGTIYLLRR